MRAGLPVQAHGVAVDTLSIRDGEEHLKAALVSPEVSEGVPVAPVEALVYLKLTSPRAKDRLDVLELVQAGLDVERARAYLDKHAPHLAEKLARIVEDAEREEQ